MDRLVWTSLAWIGLTAAGCSTDGPMPPGTTHTIDPARVTATPLDDTTTTFPIQFGQSANYTILVGDRGSFEFYRHNTRTEIASGPNQPYLELPGEVFTETGWHRFDLGEFSLPSERLFLEDADELVFGPMATEAGLQVMRKVRISPADDVIRSLEILKNPTAVSLTVAARVTSPSDGSLLLDDNGDGRVTGLDRYFAGFDSLSGAVGILMDNDGADRIDDIEDTTYETEFTWVDVVVPPHSMAIYAHFVALSPDSVASEVRAVLEGVLEQPCWEGLTTGEASVLRNFAVNACPNVVGTLGAAPSGRLTVTNQTTGQSATADVQLDGTFGVAVAAVAGQVLLLTHERGEETTVVVEPGS